MSTSLFFPFSARDGFTTISIFIGSVVAAGGGLGGGGVFIPIFLLVLSVDTDKAAALSQATIFGGSIVNLLMNSFQSHPERKHRPLIDFRTLLIFEPMLLLGTNVGVLLSIVFPDILTLVVLILTLTFATKRTLCKAIKMYKYETEMNDNIKDHMRHIPSGT
jgi:uncharacterized membrane protein YfcA